MPAVITIGTRNLGIKYLLLWYLKGKGCSLVQYKGKVYFLMHELYKNRSTYKYAL